MRGIMGAILLSGVKIFSFGKKNARAEPPAGFFRRWLMAACECLRFSWCKRLLGDHGQMVIMPCDGFAKVEIVDGEQVEALPPIELAPSDDASVESAGRYADNLGKRQIVLRIARQQAVRRSVSLPAAVAENLERVIASELDRLTPFAAEQVFFDFFTQPAPRGVGMLDIDLAVTLRSFSEPWLRRLAELGIKPHAIDIEGGWQGQNLLPHGQREKKKKNSLLTLLLLIIVIALGAVALGIPLYEKRQMVLDLGELERAAQKRANHVLALRTAVTETREASRRVLDKRLKTIPLVELIAELSHIMPDNTWVQNMDIDDEKLQLRGETSQASSLIGLLEASTMFRDVVFSSPVVQVPRSNKERFHISATLEHGAH
jgi:general secretion pathway protein L